MNYPNMRRDILMVFYEAMHAHVECPLFEWATRWEAWLSEVQRRYDEKRRNRPERREQLRKSQRDYVKRKRAGMTAKQRREHDRAQYEARKDYYRQRYLAKKAASGDA